MTYIIEVFAYQRLQVTCSNFKIAVSSPILPGETGLSDILMIYSKEFLSGIAWKGYLLHAGPYMRRNGWMVGIQLETLGPFERSYSFSFSKLRPYTPCAFDTEIKALESIRWIICITCGLSVRCTIISSTFCCCLV